MRVRGDVTSCRAPDFARGNDVHCVELRKAGNSKRTKKVLVRGDDVQDVELPKAGQRKRTMKGRPGLEVMLYACYGR